MLDKKIAELRRRCDDTWERAGEVCAGGPDRTQSSFGIQQVQRHMVAFKKKNRIQQARSGIRAGSPATGPPNQLYIHNLISYKKNRGD